MIYLNKITLGVVKMPTKQILIDSMIASGFLKTDSIIKAFQKVDRKFFIPKEFKENIYDDRPLPIGDNQTISQPSTVAFMLELLNVQEGNKILEIGSGSGWVVALLCYLATQSGSVLGLERVDKLVKTGQNNLLKLGFKTNCIIKKAGTNLGVPGNKFDRILVSASADNIPKILFEQLNTGGNLVMPVKNSILKFKKISETKITKQEFPGFVFVPLIV